MIEDWRGNPVTAERPETVAAIDTFAREFLGYGLNAAEVLKAATAEPDCVMANALSAALFLFLEDARAPDLARPYIDAASGNRERATRRERLFLDAIAAWAARDALRAAALHDAIAEEFPADIVSAKLGQYHRFNRGDFDGLLRIAERVFPANRDLAYMHGMIAFGYEQTHRLAEAERAGRRAVEMLPREPWAHHAVAHVMETQGRVDEGIAWMKSHAPSWADCNSFMLTHNYWHLALFHMDRDEPDQALELFDRRVWGAFKEYSQDQINAISLLWRLELRGLDVGERWADLSEHVAARGPEHVEPFHDLHYVYALARGERISTLDRLMTSLRDHCAARREGPDRFWPDVALPAARGVVAYAQGDHATAFARLREVQPRLHEIGGSHAQRDLFVQTFLDAALRSGNARAVEAELQRRHAARPNVAVTARWLARATGG